jgi:hypothetical protein
MINDDDCDLILPSPTETRHGLSRGFHGHARQSTRFSAVIQVVQLFAALQRTLKSSVISPQAMQQSEAQMRSKMALLPDSFQFDSDAYLATDALSPVFALQTARFHLYRRNIAPVCHRSERAAALSSCVAVAQDTARYISRTLGTPQTPAGKPGHDKGWRTRVAHMASNMVCMHIWRCMLILCLRGDYSAALLCLQVSSAIGDLRAVNRACGSNLVFFLDRLTERVSSGNGNPRQLEQDEEMLAYASGDLQSSLEHSWIWTGSDHASANEPSSASSQQSPHALSSTEPMQGVLALRPSPSAPENANKERDCWGRIEQQIRHLMEEHRPRIAPAPLPSYYPPPHNPVKRVQLTPDANLHPAKSMPSSSASRISIANII